MKTMNTSEFANYILNRFENAAMYKDEYRTNFYVLNPGCYDVISVYERKNGITKVRVNGVSYTKMNAAEKKAALDFVNTLEFDKVETYDFFQKKAMVTNYIRGIYTEGEVRMVSGGDTPWYKVEKVTKIQ